MPTGDVFFKSIGDSERTEKGNGSRNLETHPVPLNKAHFSEHGQSRLLRDHGLR